MDLDQYDNLKALALKLKAGMDDQTKVIDSLKGELTQAQQREGQRAQRERHGEALRVLNDECGALEKKLGGAAHRNAVLDKVTAEFATCKVPDMPPESQADWVRKSLRLAYQEAIEADKASQKTKPKGAGTIVDTGTGGTNIAAIDIPEGRMDEVFSKFAAAMQQE